MIDLLYFQALAALMLRRMQIAILFAVLPRDVSAVQLVRLNDAIDVDELRVHAEFETLYRTGAKA